MTDGPLALRAERGEGGESRKASSGSSSVVGDWAGHPSISQLKYCHAIKQSALEWMHRKMRWLCSVAQVFTSLLSLHQACLDAHIFSVVSIGVACSPRQYLSRALGNRGPHQKPSSISHSHYPEWTPSDPYQPLHHDETARPGYWGVWVCLCVCVCVCFQWWWEGLQKMVGREGGRWLTVGDRCPRCS